MAIEKISKKRTRDIEVSFQQLPSFDILDMDVGIKNVEFAFFGNGVLVLDCRI